MNYLFDDVDLDDVDDTDTSVEGHDGKYLFDDCELSIEVTPTIDPENPIESIMDRLGNLKRLERTLFQVRSSLMPTVKNTITVEGYNQLNICIDYMLEEEGIRSPVNPDYGDKVEDHVYALETMSSNLFDAVKESINVLRPSQEVIHGLPESKERDTALRLMDSLGV